MYEIYWNIKEKPFRNVTDKRFFFYAETYEEAYLRLLYNIKESQGLFCLMGEGGCGKSILLKIFAQDLIEQGYRVVFIQNPTISPQELLQEILYELGQAYSSSSKIELLKELKKYAAAVDNKNCVLVVEDAHLIKDFATFQEIRLLLNMESNNRLLFSPILVGKPELAPLLDKTVLKDRIGLQYELLPLNYRQTGEYIYYRMNQAGAAREIFTVDALKEIYTVSHGIPREINNICDLALLLGYGENAIVIDRNLIVKAVSDLKNPTGRKVNLHQKV